MAKRKKAPVSASTLPSAASRAPRATDIGAHAALLALLAALLLITIVRLRLLDLPLERDEGEYAYAGQLMLDGVPPYRLVYNMKFPGTYAAYALLMSVFGESVRGIRIGILLVSAITAVLTWLLTRRLFGNLAAAAAALAYAVLSLGIPPMAPYGHATHFVSLFAVAGVLLLAPRDDKPRAWYAALAAGVMLALAILMKQPGVTVAALALLWLAIFGGTTRWRDLALAIAGMIATFGITALLLWRSGVFERFWFWTVRYASEYGTQSTLADARKSLHDQFPAIFETAWVLWLGAIAGLILLFLDSETRKRWPFAIAFVAGMSLATVPGLYFRQHYFIVMFPALALLVGAGIAVTARKFGRLAGVATIALILLITIVPQWPGWMSVPVERITRLMYLDNPFPEAPEIGRYLRENTTPEDRIAILGSEPEIYFHADRKSATGYIYMYPLMESQPYAKTMQQELMAEIDRANPKYLVSVSVRMSWGVGPNSDRSIFAWTEKKVNSGYRLDGLVDLAPGGTRYAWGADAEKYQPQGESVIMLFKRP